MISTAVHEMGCKMSGGALVRPLAPVLVEEERLIRTDVGLRPHRPAGFRLESVRFGEKRVIHNYGHGGGGISLCWGAAKLVANLALEGETRNVAVLGCGAIGLASARLLQDCGFSVTIYAEAAPADTTSYIAGAQWSPSTFYDPNSVTSQFRRDFVVATKYSYEFFQKIGPSYGVRWLENYLLREAPYCEIPFDPLRREIDDCYPCVQDYGPGQHRFHTKYACRFMTMFINPMRLLDALYRDFLMRGGRLVLRKFHLPSEISELAELLVVNCTGMGAKVLFDDADLVGVKGQLHVLLPQPDVDYIVVADGAYMFPREDGILLGGTWERDATDGLVNHDAQREIFRRHKAIFAGL